MDSSNGKPTSGLDDAPQIKPQKLGQQLKCVNRKCDSGDELTDAIEMVCTYYHIMYKPHKKVCMKCYITCLNHYKNLEKQFKAEKCIMDGHFPSYDSYFVIDSSSSGEEENDSDQRPNGSKVNSPLDSDVTAMVDVIVAQFCEENKGLIEKQNQLCNDFIEDSFQTCLQKADEIDIMVKNLQKEIDDFKNLLYEPHRPTITVLDSVDIDELEKQKEEAKKTIIKPIINQEEDTTDKDIITLNSTICFTPADLPKEGLLEYPPLRNGQVVYAMKETLVKPWCKCKIKSVINNDYMHIKFDSEEKLLTTKQVAFSTQNPVRFPVGSRVIAKFLNPYSTNIHDFFYAGVVAEPPKILNKFRYMIFFDDGSVQYRHHKDIRLIVHKSNQVWKDIYIDSQEFIENYLKHYPERQMVKLIENNIIRAEFNNQWQTAKVLEVDASLVRLYFLDLKKTEWLYRGSSRLWNIFEKQSKSKRGIRLRQSGLAYLKKPFVEFTSIEEETPKSELVKSVARKSTSKGVTSPKGKITKTGPISDFQTVLLKIPKDCPEPKHYQPHICNKYCVEWTMYDYKKTSKISMLATPLHFGFSRILVYFKNSEVLDIQKCVMYKTPCGYTIRNMKEMHDYLLKTGSKMTVDQFDFSSWVKPMAEFQVLKSKRFLFDLSMGKEFRPITCVNNINQILPPNMEYMTTRQPMPGVNINLDTNFLCGCDCTDNCQDKSKCACWQMTIEGQKIIPNTDNYMKDPNYIGYNYRRLPDRVLTGIYECNKTCKCKSSCLNRVVQHPLTQKLQLFLTEKKGWGVRCLNDIPQGSFICIYVGYLLTESDANEGGKNYGDEYLAELDYIEVVEKVKEDYEADVRQDSDEEDIEQEDKNDELFNMSDDDNFPSTSEGNKVVTDFTSRLRKRKKPKHFTSSKIKKDGRHDHISSELSTRHIKNNPEPSKSMREYFGENESVYIMDAKTSGNIGRYLNHSCFPNTYVQNVFVDTHDIRFPWVSFFALHYIQAGTELTWDYSYDVGSVPGKSMKCHCQSVYCRGRLL